MNQEMMGGSEISWTICKSIYTSLQTDNHASTSSLNFLQAGCSSWCQSTKGNKLE